MDCHSQFLSGQHHVRIDADDMFALSKLRTLVVFSTIISSPIWWILLVIVFSRGCSLSAVQAIPPPRLELTLFRHFVAGSSHSTRSSSTTLQDTAFDIKKCGGTSRLWFQTTPCTFGFPNPGSSFLFPFLFSS